MTSRIAAGSIALLVFPFADGAMCKRRPALVLKDLEDGDMLVCRITSRIYSSKYDIYLTQWQQYGLKLPSVVRVHKMAVLETNMIETIIGQLDDAIMHKVKAVYKSII